MVALGNVAPLVRRPVTIDECANYPELGVRSFGRGTFHKPSLPGGEVGSKRLFRIEAGDLLFNIVFAWEGAVAIATSADHGRVGSHRFLTCVTEPITASFLRYFFLTEEGLRLLGQASPGGAGRNRTLGLKQLNAIPVPFPPLSKQRRITAKLDAAAEHVAARSRALAAIEAELNATVLIAFDRISADAPRRPMGEVAPLVRRPVTIDEDASYLELGVRSFGKGTFHKPALPGIEVGSKRLFRVEAGDLVFNIVFAWEGAVAVAADTDSGRVGSHRFLTCTPQAATASLLRYFFLTEEGLRLLGEASPGGAGRNRTLGLKALDAIQVPVPSLDAQRWFDTVQHKAASIRATHAAASADLAALLPTLLAEAFGAVVPPTVAAS